MSKAAKRERQRLNREARREAEIATTKRRQRLKIGRNVAIVAVPLVAIFVVAQVLRDDDEKAAGAITCADVEKPPAKDTTFPAPPPMEIDTTKLYTARIETSCGTMEVLLDAAQAPTVVNNFVFLARQGFYDDTTFHRAAKDFVIQGGDPKGDGSGGPGYSIPGEVPASGIGYRVGSLAMAKGGAEPPGTAGSQFFVATDPVGLQGLNTEPYQYAVLGQLENDRSLRIAQKIESLANPDATDDPATQTLTKTVVIRKVTITETTPDATTTTAPATSAPPPAS